MTNWHTPCDDLELESESLERLAFEYRNCQDQESLSTLREEFRRRDAGQAELVTALRAMREIAEPYTVKPTIERVDALLARFPTR